MATPLQPGANQTIAARSGTVVVSHDADAGLDVNLTAFLLTDQGRAQGDSGIVFYNQPDGPGGIARFVAPADEGGRPRHRIDFDLDRAPAGIVKLAVALTEDKGRGFAAVRNLRAEVRSGGEVVELVPGSFGAERGIIALELYTRNDQPKVRAVWQGFASGLDGLCRLYGIEVTAEPPPPPPPVAPPAAKPSVNLQKVSGKVDLAKGQKGVLIEKTPEIVATISWSSGTDYDVYALVLTRAGKQVDVAMFEAEGVPVLQNYGNGAVVHDGDVKSGGGALKTETLRIRLNDDILAVVPVAYSAQSNGTGSFRRYQVSMTIDNRRGTTVTVPAENADKNATVYTCVPGLILNTRDGVVIEPLELYSKPGSERRPKVVIAFDDTVKVEMDQGPKNKYK